MTADLARYAALLGEVRARIAGAQTRAALAANRELMLLYWEIGHLIHERQATEGWGAAVIPRLARDLAGDAQGFSERNLKRMVQYHRAYPELGRLPGIRAEGNGGAVPIGLQPVAPVPAVTDAEACAILSVEVPWGHNILLLQKIPDVGTRLWYLRSCLSDGWSLDVLGLMIKSEAHTRQGAAITNFQARLPAPQSDLARQTLKDPYVFDFLALDAGFRERELEVGLLAHLERFLLELGVGFAFVREEA